MVNGIQVAKGSATIVEVAQTQAFQIFVEKARESDYLSLSDYSAGGHKVSQGNCGAKGHKVNEVTVGQKATRLVRSLWDKSRSQGQCGTKGCRFETSNHLLFHELGSE